MWKGWLGPFCFFLPRAWCEATTFIKSQIYYLGHEVVTFHFSQLPQSLKTHQTCDLYPLRKTVCKGTKGGCKKVTGQTLQRVNNCRHLEEKLWLKLPSLQRNKSWWRKKRGFNCGSVREIVAATCRIINIETIEYN